MPYDRCAADVWLIELGREIERVGYPPEPFLTRVRERLELGDQEYGDRYRTLDLIQEGREETWDLAAYAALDTELRNTAGGGGQHHLQRAAVLAALADWHLRQARAIHDSTRRERPSTRG